MWFSTGRSLGRVAAVIDEDSNGDSRLSTADRIDVVMANTIGLSPKTVLTAIYRLIGYALVDDATAVLFVRDENRGTRAVRVSLDGFSIVRDDAFAPSSDR